MGGASTPAALHEKGVTAVKSLKGLYFAAVIAVVSIALAAIIASILLPRTAEPYTPLRLQGQLLIYNRVEGHPEPALVAGDDIEVGGVQICNDAKRDLSARIDIALVQVEPQFNQYPRIEGFPLRIPKGCGEPSRVTLRIGGGAMPGKWAVLTTMHVSENGRQQDLPIVSELFTVVAREPNE